MSYGTCKYCGCTDNNACNHPDHGPCWWIDDSHEICSHCYIEEINNDPATTRFVAGPAGITVECCHCGDVHQWSERLVEEEESWVTYRCPICKDESYFTCESLSE